jgi:hypothetical protein
MSPGHTCFAGVHAEIDHAQIDEIVEEISDLLTDVFTAQLQVAKS